MARLMLKFDGRTIDEYGLGLMVTIGRTPDNVLTIDNPAVSSHHACVFRDGDAFVLEDFDSTNGTFVNGARVRRHVLADGDLILVGKHTLVFDAKGTARPLDADGDEPAVAGLRDTVFLDVDQRRKLLARLTSARTSRAAAADAGAPAAHPPATTPHTSATLHVLAGHTERTEYPLESPTSLIGTAEAALVRVRGLFKPPIAVVITRRNHGYVATSIRGTNLINGLPLTGRRDLREGDVLQVSGVTLEFRDRRATPSADPA